MIQDFLEGKLVFTIATTDAVAALASAKEEGSFAYDYGIALMPDPSPELTGRSMSVTGAVAVNGYSEHQKLANDFAAFLVDGYVENLYDLTGKAPANRKANQDNGALQIFLAALSSVQPRSFVLLMITCFCYPSIIQKNFHSYNKFTPVETKSHQSSLKSCTSS